MKTKKGLTVWVLLLLAIGVRGQVLDRQVIASTGGGTTTHSFTMGEVLISSQQLEVTVGFQQPAFLEAGEEPLGLQDITSQLNVYPRPTVNELTINGDLFDGQGTSINLFSAEGKRLDVSVNRFEKEIKLDLSPLKGGYYYLSLHNEATQTVANFKILKR